MKINSTFTPETSQGKITTLRRNRTPGYYRRDYNTIEDIDRRMEKPDPPSQREKTTEEKYLAVTFDEVLTFSKHLKLM